MAVLLPGIVLSLIAMRATSRENAYIEQRMRTSLISEITLTKSIIEESINSITAELDSIIPLAFDTLSKLKENDGLIGVPFLLSDKREILWPLYNTALSQTALDFFKFNKEFFQDRVPTPIYKKQENPVGRQQKTIRKSKSSTVKKEEDLLSKLFYFDSSASQNHLTAGMSFNSKPVKKTYVKKKSAPKVKLKSTIDYVESLKFSQIIKDKNSGIISRLIDNQIMLLYWKKTDNNRIQGCVINEKELKDRLIKKIPQPYTEVRILTILDQVGNPIYKPSEKKDRKWDAPFLRQDLHEHLQQWEMAVYLTNPDSISNQAQFNTIVISLLIGMFFITFLFGGVRTIQSLQNEMRLAQQKTTFVANVSHELKTPLTSIRLFAEILKEKRQSDEQKQQSYLGIMISEIERLTRLINNVLDFSQSKNSEKLYNMRAVNLVELCKDLLDIQRVRLEYNGFKVLFNSDKDNIHVIADMEALKQALVNIISNAEKYSAGTKEISLSIKSLESCAKIEISDKGIGVSQENRKKIFNEFFRVDDTLTASVSGTGLGLTITKKIIEDHNGTIEYRANTPEGSIFSVSLPIAGV